MTSDFDRLSISIAVGKMDAGRLNAIQFVSQNLPLRHGLSSGRGERGPLYPRFRYLDHARKTP